MIETKEALRENISTLIKDLYDDDGLTRQRARLLLIDIGPQAVPELLHVMDSSYDHARWEAAKALGAIKDPVAACVLVDALEDEDIDLRWAAMESLIALDRSAVRPLMEGLTRNFSSVWFREGAHHVLHVWKDKGRLYPFEIKVLEALEGIAPDVEVPWAAKAAIDALDEIKQSISSK